MAGERESGPSRSRIRESGTDAFRLTVNYLKQETLGPLKGLARTLVFGLLGAISLAIAVVLWLLAILRILETETGAFHGNLSWLPYLIVMALATVVIGAAIWRITRGPAARRRRAARSEGRNE